MRTFIGLAVGNVLLFTIGEFLPWWIGVNLLLIPTFAGYLIDDEEAKFGWLKPSNKDWANDPEACRLSELWRKQDQAWREYQRASDPEEKERAWRKYAELE
jgi:hypothetical protein